MNNFDTENLNQQAYTAPKISRLGNLTELTQAMRGGYVLDGNGMNMYMQMGGMMS